MIPSYDLRRLNFVYDVDGKTPVRIKTIYPYHIEAVTNEPRIINPRTDEIFPIQLTKEVLEKIGFKPEGEEFKDFVTLKLDEYLAIKFDLTNLTYMIIGKPGYIVNSYTFRHIKSLHQLQNFFHSWTGEELNIEL